MNPIHKTIVSYAAGFRRDGRPPATRPIRHWAFTCPKCGATEACPSWPARNVNSRKVAKDLLHKHMTEVHAAL